MANERTHIRPHIRDHVFIGTDHYGPGEPPTGFEYIVDEFGVYVIDENGEYIIQAV